MLFQLGIFAHCGIRYLGGKTKLAKRIAETIKPRGYWWEPFCGGLSVSCALAAYGPGLVSDFHPALIHLYQAVQNGWRPPAELSKNQYEEAKRLPDSNPLKGFAGFGCSFGGMYFQSYAKGGSRNYAKESGNLLIKRVSQLNQCNFQRLSFFDVEPSTRFSTIYCDPPYAGTAGYSTGAFDHSRFWMRCQEWARLGVEVYVSEFSCPIDAELVWSQSRKVSIGSGKAQVLEKLFKIL